MLKDYPLAGPFAVAEAYIFCTVLFIPGSIPALGAGFAFKQAYNNTWRATLVGTAAVWLGASVGAWIAMLLGRFVFKDWAIKKAEKYPLINAINIAIESEGLKLIFLLRLCPLIPFNALNYLMGITNISVKHYNIGSIGMIPGTMV